MAVTTFDADDFYSHVDAGMEARDSVANDDVDVARAVPPPGDPRAEAELLGNLLYPGNGNRMPEVVGLLESKHFSSRAYGAAFEACGAVHARGLIPSVVDVAQQMERATTLQMFAYRDQDLAALVSCAVLPPRLLAQRANSIIELWRKRQAIEVLQRAAAAGYGGADADSLIESTKVKLDALTTPPNARSNLSLVERVRAMRDAGPVTRFATGLRTLDENCRGGLRFGTLMVGGAPGVGKTALAVQWAHAGARAGTPCAFVAADEGVDDILMRLALQEGLDAERLEKRDPAEWDEFESRMADLPLHLFDVDDGATLETAAVYLAKTYAGKRCILFGDSIQTLPSPGEDDAPRARVDRVIKSAKALARTGLLVVLTSELGRGAYRNKDNAANVDPLAAFKESGGIEYGVQTALLLRSVPKGDGVVVVDVPKNRGGRKNSFHIEIDRWTRVREVSGPGEGDNGSHNTEIAKDARCVLQVIATNPGIGERALRAKVTAAGLKMGVTRLDVALDHLLTNTRRVENRPTAHGQRTDAHYFAVRSDEKSEEP